MKIPYSASQMTEGALQTFRMQTFSEDQIP